MQRVPSRQNGAILVMTVFFIVILLAFSALAIDLGRLYVLRTQMQNAADAAALAAAAELDGNTNAINDAVLAAKNLLQHQGRFSTQPELLKILKYDPSDPEQSAFEFYSWINSENDPIPDICTPHASEDKCMATGDADAHYVKVKLHPDLVIDEKEYFQISLYLVPVLGIFPDDGPMMKTASTTVTAVAGAGGPVFCKYPPIFMCAFEEGDEDNPTGYPGIGIGEEVKLKDKDASTPWGPGNVGFLQVEEEIEIPLDNGGTKLVKNVDAIAAALGNEFIKRECDPAIVSTKTGVTTQKTREAINSRFGLYSGPIVENAKKAFPPAPNTIDYPLDDVFSPESPAYNEEAFKGDGWNNTECLVGGIPAPLEECGEDGDGPYTRPETFNRADYVDYNHTIAPPATLNDSRFALYNWEILSSLNMPQLETGSLTNLDDTNSRGQQNCSESAQEYCWLHSGDPIGGDPSLGSPERRILRVAVIKCSKHNISGNTPDIDLNADGEFPFHEFFLTQHIQAPSSAEFFAEYVGPVSEQKDIQEIKHTVIQLYE
ncbi:MAG: Tad domain-containing protein [Pseudomonadota bacterium]